jgi:dienelactone hydrolase
VIKLSAAHEALVATVPARAGEQLEETTVAYENEGHELEGYAVHDASVPGPKPVVVIVHDWTGLREYPKARARMLARLGYYAFAADVYGKGRRFDDDGPASAEAHRYYGDLPLLRARVRAAYDTAAASPAADPARIAVIGYCFGGSAALEFARTGAPLAATASFHGGLIAHDPPEVGAITGPLLVATGGADPVVPDEAVVAFENELRTRADLDWQVTVYSGAPHGFTLPGSAYREKADRRSWRALAGLLDEVF